MAKAVQEAILHQLLSRHAGGVDPGPLASQLAQLTLVRHGLRGQKARDQTKLEADGVLAFAHLADLSALVALRHIVRFVLRFGALGLPPIAECGSVAVVLVLAQDLVVAIGEAAALVAARPFAGTALGERLPLAAFLLVLLLRHGLALAGEAALLLALLLVEPAITVFALFHDFVATERSVRVLEAVGLAPVGDRVQHGRDVGFGALRELVVVVAVSAGGRGEHDVVSVLAAGSTL